MVLFENVCIGQRVEVLWNNEIFKGTVQYKGPIVTKRGEWVGVALDLPVGNSTGMLFARRYFQCPLNHGVFVRSDKLRFIPSVRCLYDRYHRLSSKSNVDEYLFQTSYPEVQNGSYDPINVSQKDIQRVRSSLGDYRSTTESMWEKPKHYHLRNSVSNHIPAATMLKTATQNFRYLSRPIYVCHWKDDEDFERKPSIPKIHMPHSALKEQVQRGWNNAHYVREMTVPTGRDKIKFSQWNDISP